MRKAKPGISKEQGYRVGIFSAHYDLQAMIKAYGPQLIHALVDICTLDGELTPNDLETDISEYVFVSNLISDDLELPAAKPKRDARGRFIKANAA